MLLIAWILQKELNVRVVKGRVKGREDGLKVWYQGLLHEVATAYQFIELGIAARKGTPKVCMIHWWKTGLIDYAKTVGLIIYSGDGLGWAASPELAIVFKCGPI